MSDIFISYAAEDRPRAQVIAQLLGGHGWSIFWDRTIPIGRTWVIGKELDEARCVIVLWSKISIGSGWVQDEADDGKRRGVLVPVLIEDVLPPIGFRSIQAADLTNWDGTEATQSVRTLVQGITEIIGPPAKEAEEERERTEAEAQRRAEERKRTEAEAQRRAEEERKRTEAETQRRAEEERKRTEAEAQRRAEEERKRTEAEAQRRGEEERRRTEAEAQRRGEEERRRTEAEAQLTAVKGPVAPEFVTVGSKPFMATKRMIFAGVAGVERNLVIIATLTSVTTIIVLLSLTAVALRYTKLFVLN
jgi:flagellar biosynthesis GTPase FlhF